LAVYAHWVNPELRRHLRSEEVDQDLSELNRRIGLWTETSTEPDTPYTARVFSTVLGFIVAPNSEEKEKLGEVAKNLLERLLKFEDQLADFDRAEYAFFLAQIAR